MSFFDFSAFSSTRRGGLGGRAANSGLGPPAGEARMAAAARPPPAKSPTAEGEAQVAKAARASLDTMQQAIP